MKIDYSKWIFVSNRGNGAYYTSDGLLKNITENIVLSISFRKQNKDIDTDNPDKWIKEQCKHEIRRYYIDKRLEELNEKQIPVEDNLDYIENEAEKRGLI